MTDADAFLETLPDRPLLLSEAEHLAETGPIHPGSVFQAPGEPLVFTLIVTGEETVYGVGFDDAAEAWNVVTTHPTDDGGHAAVGQELKTWGQDQYDEADHVEREVQLEAADRE